MLAELSDTAQRARGFPLIAWQRYGAGKCMFVGTDQLWRLRARTGDKYHLKFWGQAIQFLTLSRLLGDNQRLRLQTGQEEYALGEPVEMFANVLSDLYEPLSSPAFTVYVAPLSGGEPQSLALRAMPGLPGMYQGFFTPAAPGRYRISASAEDEAPAGAGATPPGRAPGAQSTAAVEFDVRPDAAELVDTSMHREVLARAVDGPGGALQDARDILNIEHRRRQWSRGCRLLLAGQLIADGHGHLQCALEVRALDYLCRASKRCPPWRISGATPPRGCLYPTFGGSPHAHGRGKTAAYFRPRKTTRASRKEPPRGAAQDHWRVVEREAPLGAGQLDTFFPHGIPSGAPADSPLGLHQSNCHTHRTQPKKKTFPSQSPQRTQRI